MRSRRTRQWSGPICALGLAFVVTLTTTIHAEDAATAQVPTDLLDRPAADGATLDRLFASLRAVENFDAAFREEKKLTLLVKPLKSEGTIYFEREHGLARHARTPKVQKLRLTETSLTLWNGSRTEEVKLDQSRDLSALALSFPRLLRGDNKGLAVTFDIKMQGNEGGWWGLSLVPKDASLRRMLTRITVVGQRDTVQSVSVDEPNGDRTRTTFSDVHKNVARSASETEAIFRLP